VTPLFGTAYADAYDSLYGDKRYTAECDVIGDALAQYELTPTASILDLGCGSGNHALPLAAAGFSVTGVDRSAAMLAHARRKAAQTGEADRLTFFEDDIRRFDLNRTFDAALMMFAVLGYQLENRDVLAALLAARRHLSPGGLFLFDCWYGPTVISQRPSDRVKTVQTGDGPLTRFTSSVLDVRSHTCRVDFRVETGGQATHETHAVRFFFPRELELFLDLAGFTLVRLGCFPDFRTDPDETAWNVMGVARAVA
jgi:SAM-dependent methyltransferase